MEENRTSEPARPEDRPEPKRRKRWPTVVAVLIVLAAIAGLVAYDYYVARFKRSEPYRMALELLQKDTKAKEQLGAPIKDATSIFHLDFPGGFVDKDRGDANLAFKVSGPKGKADVWVQARRFEGKKWFLSVVAITPTGEEKISLDIPPEFAGDTAPVFVPGAGGGGVEPPKPRPSKTPPGGKPAPDSKEPAGAGPSRDIDMRDLDVK
jgi:hypothetical protein